MRKGRYIYIYLCIGQCCTLLSPQDPGKKLLHSLLLCQPPVLSSWFRRHRKSHCIHPTASNRQLCSQLNIPSLVKIDMMKRWEEGTWASLSVADHCLLQSWTRSSPVLWFFDDISCSCLGSTAASHTAITPWLPIANHAVNWKSTFSKERNYADWCWLIIRSNQGFCRIVPLEFLRLFLASPGGMKTPKPAFYHHCHIHWFYGKSWCMISKKYHLRQR